MNWRAQIAAAAALASVAWLSGCGQADPQALVESASRQAAAQAYPDVVIQAKAALQQDPSLAQARYLLGLGLLRTGDPAGAEAELLRALEGGHAPDLIDPLLAQSLLAQRKYQRVVTLFAAAQPRQTAPGASISTSLATAYFLLGDTQAAESALAAALAADPADPRALLLRARTQAVRGDTAAALAGVEALLLQQAANADAWILKAELLSATPGASAAVLAAYQQAASLRPDDLSAQAKVVGLLLRDGRVDDADAALAKVKKLAPDDARVRFLVALIAFDRQDFKQVQAQLRPVLVQTPNDLPALLLAADAELALQAPLAAEPLLTRALELAPQSALARRLLASALLRMNQAPKALATLQPLLGMAAPDAAVLTLAAEAMRQTGDAKRAEALYARAAQAAPDNPRARTALLLAQLGSGGGDQALAELRRVAASNPDTTADMALIGAHIVKQEFDQALAAIAALERKQPGQPLAANLRGRALLARGDRAGARQSFERALVLAPGYFPAVDGLAAVDLADGQPQAAGQRFEALLAKDSNDAQALLALANLRAATGGSKDAVVALLQRALAAAPQADAPRLALVELHLRNGDHAAAVAAGNDAVAALPASAALLDALGRAQQGSGDLNQAMASFNKLATLQPQSPLPLMRLAMVQLQGKNNTAATTSLRKALALQPDLLEAQRALATLALQAGDTDRATALARDVQTQRPKQDIGYLMEAEVAASRKQWEAAFAVYERGLRQTPSTELARRAYTALGAAGKSAARERFAAEWLKAHPRDATFRLYLGDIHAAQGELAAAEQLYTAVTVLQPSNATAFNNLAWVSGRLRRPNAIAQAEKAVALAPNRPEFIDTLAELLGRDRQIAKALQWQGKAVALQPQQGSYRLNLARLHILDGNKAQARKELQTVVELGDKFRSHAEAQKLLQSL